MNEKTDYLIYNFNSMLTRSKSTSWRTSITAQTVALMTFLKNNNLILLNPFDENGNIKPDLIIRQSHLTEEGNKLFSKAVPKWFNYIDRGGKLENISHLEKGLKSIRDGAPQ